MADLKIFAENLEESAKKQVDEIASCPAFEGATIRIMPDAHAGKGCVIGFTANLGDKVIPNLVGVDIGCGMLCVPLDERIDRGDLIQFNRDVKKAVPTGFSVHNEPKCSLENDYGVVNGAYLKGVERIECSMGTLGGGNHFVELDEDEYGYQYLVVHTGSRNLGKQVAEYHQAMAQEMCKEDVPRDLKYLVSFAAGAYLNDMRICQRYATDNRFHILKQIKERTGIKLDLSARFETMHNYISDDNVIRKGAISAHTRKDPPVVAFKNHQGAANGSGTDESEPIAGYHNLNDNTTTESGINSVVRRLTPLECERLQGFPDNHTRIPWKGKPAEECPDSLRYKACGNSMAVPVMRWLGERIEAVDRL